MPATTLYPCVTEKQIYLNGDLYNQDNRVQNLKKYGVENKADNKNEDDQHNFKSIMIIDVLNRLRPQLNNKNNLFYQRPACTAVNVNTNTTTTTTTAAHTKPITTPQSALSNLTTSNVKRLNTYFMQQNTGQHEGSPNKDLLKFKNFKDINNKLYSLRQFYESQQKNQPSLDGDNNLVKRLNDSKIESSITKFEESLNLSNSQSKTPQTKTDSSINNSLIKDKHQKFEYENFEEKVVNDLDSIISSISMNDYHVTLDCPNNQVSSSSNKCSLTSNSSSTSSSSSSSSDSDDSSINGDDPKDDFESKFHYDLAFTSHNNDTNGFLNGKNSDVKDDFDIVDMGRENFESIIQLVLHRLPGTVKHN
jgi:hypothetical protein